ncbi:21495_t:CDS:1, partial [Racocetra persica]
MSSDPSSSLQSQNSSDNSNATLPAKKTVRKIKKRRATNVARNSFVHHFYEEDLDLRTAQ